MGVRAQESRQDSGFQTKLPPDWKYKLPKFVLFSVIQTVCTSTEKVQTMSTFIGAACSCLLFKAASAILGSTASLVFGALSYSQGAARLMIPSTTISRARTESHSATHLNRGQGPQDPCTQPHKMYLSNLQKVLSTFLNFLSGGKV